MKLKSLVLALFLAVAASAQVAELSLSGGVSKLSNNDIGSLSTTGRGNDLELGDGFRLGFRLTLNNWKFFGHEVGYAYNRTKLRLTTPPKEEAGTAIHQGLYNFLVYAVPEGLPVRPFLTGGGHFSNFQWPGQSVTYGGGSTKFGFNYGGGVKVRLGPMYMIRLDFRQYMTGKPFDLPLQSGMLRQNEISAGFGIGL